MNKKSLQEVLKENHENYIKREKQRKQKEQSKERKQKIIKIIVSILILFLTFKMIANMNNKAIDNCMAKGYSRTTCLAHL